MLHAMQPYKSNAKGDSTENGATPDKKKTTNAIALVDLLNKSELGICKAHQCQPDVWNPIRKHLGLTAPIATYLDFALVFNKTHF